MAKNKGGRPKINIDWKQFESLCELQCTKLEICNYFNITDKTLESRIQEHYKMSFSEVFAIKRGGGKMSLRRMQWQMAAKSPAMAIFLGKNFLNQSDKHELEHTGGVKIIKDDLGIT